MPDRLPDFGKYVHDRYQENAINLSVSGGDVLVSFSPGNPTALSFVVIVSDEERFMATLETAQLSYEEGLKLAEYIKSGGSIRCQANPDRSYIATTGEQVLPLSLINVPEFLIADNGHGRALDYDRQRLEKAEAKRERRSQRWQQNGFHQGVLKE